MALVDLGLHPAQVSSNFWFCLSHCRVGDLHVYMVSFAVTVSRWFTVEKMQLDVCCFKEKGTSETFLQLSWRCLRSDTGNLPMRNKSPYYDIIHTPDSVLWLQLGVFLGSSSHRFMSLHFYFVVWITPGLRVLYLSSFHRHRLDARVCVRMTPPGVLLRAKPSAATSARVFQRSRFE